MGEITVSGGKNTAVAVIPATLLCNQPCTIENLPDIDDVHALIEILEMLGAIKKEDANERAERKIHSNLSGKHSS